MSHEIIVILDFGSQYNQLIARKVRQAGVFCQILPYNTPIRQIQQMHPKGIIFTGGPASVYVKQAPFPDSNIFKCGIPIFGICYGLQVIGKMLGGKVLASSEREYGRAQLHILEPNNPLFHSITHGSIQVWMSHGDALIDLPVGFRALAKTNHSAFAAIEEPKRKMYGVQFHPEVIHTPQGEQILKNFLYHICGCQGDWTPQNFIEDATINIRRLVGKERVILGLSGGVDSSVTAALISRAIGKKLSCIFVDNGFLRKGETEQVKKAFGKIFQVDLHMIDAKERFLRRLHHVGDPEKKRKIIGGEFIRVFESVAQKIKGVTFLAQGTLYPDLIESRSSFGGPSATIKSHHNVGGLPKRMRLKLIEPLKELFKDEVRQVGRKLGLPEEMVGRHPFPGPGLAVRILGPVTQDRLTIVEEADERFIQEIHRAGLYDQIWQAFAVLLPVKSVGVMGDERTYENVVALRAVTSSDGMTADWARIPQETLAYISNRIINEVRGVNRVVYDISSKPPATIEWE